MKTLENEGPITIGVLAERTGVNVPAPKCTILKDLGRAAAATSAEPGCCG